MNLLSKGALAAASVLALTATTASAEIVCNERRRLLARQRAARIST